MNSNGYDFYFLSQLFNSQGYKVKFEHHLLCTFHIYILPIAFIYRLCIKTNDIKFCLCLLYDLIS